MLTSKIITPTLSQKGSRERHSSMRQMSGDVLETTAKILPKTQQTQLLKSSSKIPAAPSNTTAVSYIALLVACFVSGIAISGIGIFASVFIGIWPAAIIAGVCYILAVASFINDIFELQLNPYTLTKSQKIDCHHDFTQGDGTEELSANNNYAIEEISNSQSDLMFFIQGFLMKLSLYFDETTGIENKIKLYYEIKKEYKFILENKTTEILTYIQENDTSNIRIQDLMLFLPFDKLKNFEIHKSIETSSMPESMYRLLIDFMLIPLLDYEHFMSSENPEGLKLLNNPVVFKHVLRNVCEIIPMASSSGNMCLSFWFKNSKKKTDFGEIKNIQDIAMFYSLIFMELYTKFNKEEKNSIKGMSKDEIEYVLVRSKVFVNSVLRTYGPMNSVLFARKSLHENTKLLSPGSLSCNSGEKKDGITTDLKTKHLEVKKYTNNTLYISLNQFPMVEKLDKEIWDCDKKIMKDDVALSAKNHNSIILDLRSNSGGSSTYQDFIEYFLLLNPNNPLFLLLNQSSASASESLASNLKHKKNNVVIISTRTYGKGVGQMIISNTLYNHAFEMEKTFSIGEYTKKGMSFTSPHIQGVHMDILIEPVDVDNMGLDIKMNNSHYLSSYFEKKHKTNPIHPKMNFFCLSSDQDDFILKLANAMSEIMQKKIKENKIYLSMTPDIIKDPDIKKCILKVAYSYEAKVKAALDAKNIEMSYPSIPSSVVLPTISGLNLSLKILLKDTCRVRDNKTELTFICFLKNTGDASLYNANISIQILCPSGQCSMPLYQKNFSNLSDSKLLNPLEKNVQQKVKLTVSIPYEIKESRKNLEFMVKLQSMQIEEKSVQLLLELTNRFSSLP